MRVIMTVIHSFGTAEDVTMIVIIRVIILIIFMMIVIIVMIVIIIIISFFYLSSIYKDEGCDDIYHRSILGIISAG